MESPSAMPHAIHGAVILLTNIAKLLYQLFLRLCSQSPSVLALYFNDAVGFAAFHVSDLFYSP